MAANEVAICNSALSKLGADSITSLSDTSKEAKLCNQQYSKIRDLLLYSHPWNFAVKRSVLTTNDNESAWGGFDEFDIPADCLRIIDIEVDDTEWQVESGKLYVKGQTEIGIKYISKVTDTTKFSVAFDELLATALAYELSYNLVQAVTVKQVLQQEYNLLLSDLRSFDSQEGTTMPVSNERYLRVRK